MPFTRDKGHWKREYPFSKLQKSVDPRVYVKSPGLVSSLVDSDMFEPDVLYLKTMASKVVKTYAPSVSEGLCVYFARHRCRKKLHCGKHFAFLNPHCYWREVSCAGHRVGSSMGAITSFSSLF